MRHIVLAIIIGSALSLSVFAAGPCKDKRVVKSQASKEFQKCMLVWNRDFRPDAPNPTDDCVDELKAFQQTIMGLKACWIEAKAKRTQK